MIEVKQAKVYYSPRKRKRYFSLDAACNGEARAIIEAKHPTEEFDPEDGYGFHWRELERSDVMYRRLARLIKRSFCDKQE